MNDAYSPEQLGTRIAVIGDGQMGLWFAGAMASSYPASEVVLWGHDPAGIERVRQTRRSERLPGFALHHTVEATSDAGAAMRGATLLVSAVPTQFVRPVWGSLRSRVPAGVPVVSVAKGIEIETSLRPTQVVADALGELASGAKASDAIEGERAHAVLSGPTIAAELARGLPATMIAASERESFASAVQELCSLSYLRVYTGSDPIGVEVAGALKNVIAIAAGVLDGLKAGINAKSALLARGLAEIARFGVALGAQQDTFFGIAGAGDLATTCFSPEGRNRSCGEALGRGETLEAYLARTDSVVEGVATTKSVMELSRTLGVEMPITQAVHRVLYEGMDPIEGIQLLMSRPPTSERVG